MDILVLGDRQRAEELFVRIPKGHNIQYSTRVNDASLPKFSLIFDLNFDKDSQNLQYYSYDKNKIVFAGAVKQQLAAAVSNYHGEVKCCLIGMNTLPSFIDRDLMELSLWDEACMPVIEKVSTELGWKYRIVADRVGMVTPRVVCMIINEATYTLQEGTASIADIDIAMKLGTNYPHGPFEWADLIGITHLYETLQALYEDTRDERYKICPLLKTMYLRKQRFYQPQTT
jgi:3-hydroxybutyryl-CoA dehydrogenase